MADTTPRFTRLTRNASGVGSHSSLWLADDHIVLARSTGWTEDYSRVQLRDIKAVFLVSSDRRMWWGMFWGFISVLGGFPFILTVTSGRTPFVSLIFLAAGIVGLVGNHLLGPGCRAFVVTGVQTAPLAPLIRLKQARRVLLKLQPLIEAAQADLTPVVPRPETAPESPAPS